MFDDAESGVSEGATTVTGGGRFGDSGYFVEPTVITNTRPDMKIVREEIFGPVVVAEPFRGLHRGQGGNDAAIRS